MAKAVKVQPSICGIFKNCNIRNSLKNDAIDLKFGTELENETYNKIKYRRLSFLCIFGKIWGNVTKNAKSSLGPPGKIEVKNEKDYGKKIYAVLFYT